MPTMKPKRKFIGARLDESTYYDLMILARKMGGLRPAPLSSIVELMMEQALVQYKQDNPNWFLKEES